MKKEKIRVKIKKEQNLNKTIRIIKMIINNEISLLFQNKIKII